MSLHTTPEASLTLVELLRTRSQTQSDQHLYTFLHDSGDSEAKLTYQALDQQARTIGAALQQAYPPGERALLLYPPGLTTSRRSSVACTRVLLLCRPTHQTRRA